MRCLISGTACAASGRFTVTRTISDPASARSMHWRAADPPSAVSVTVIDWTTTGAPPPTWTPPTLTPTVRCTFTTAILPDCRSLLGRRAIPCSLLLLRDERLDRASRCRIDVHELQPRDVGHVIAIDSHAAVND